MIVPGSNLLSEAFSLIGTEEVNYFQQSGRVLNMARQWVTGYNPAIEIQASVQAVSRSMYVQLGLDMNRKYVTIYACFNLLDLSRDASGDQFEHNNKRYQVVSMNDWYGQDGWASCMAVEVPKETPPP